MDRDVALPAAGEGAFLRFSLETMDRLYEEYGEVYFEQTLRRVTLLDPKCFRLCFDLMLVNSEKSLADVLETMTADEFALAITDAIYLATKGEKLSDITD